jgi:hypothetical protein
MPLDKVRFRVVNGPSSDATRLPFLTDSVEKVLSGVGTNFLRTAGALGVSRRGGPLQLERIQPATFADALRGHRQPNSAISSLLREFRCGGIFDFFNGIDPERTWASSSPEAQMWASLWLPGCKVLVSAVAQAWPSGFWNG